jgi:MbtH protein
VTSLLDDKNGSFVVLMNDEGQHSLWPEAIAIPNGWNVVHHPDTRQNCLAYIKDNWIDMRPKSLARLSVQ